MRTFMIALAALGALTSSAHAADGPANPRGEARLARLLEGRVAGPSVDCLNLRQITSTEVIDRTAIVYHVGNRLYVNRPDAGASSLDRDDILVTNTWAPQLCSIDIVRLVDRGVFIPTGFVNLGRFVPYTRPAHD